MQSTMSSISDKSVSESIRDDFLTCRICFDVFTDPRILPCLHTYCFQCIRTHSEACQTEARPVVCPECRESIPDGIKQLKSNFFINGLTEVVKAKSDEQVDCTACRLRGKQSGATEKCLDCGDFLCPSCSDGHNASSLTWKHQKITLTDLRQGTYDEKLRQLQTITCPRHKDKEVEYFCESCSQPVCLTCVLIDHRDHKCQTVSEAVSQRKSRITSLTEKIRENVSTLASRENKVSDALEEISENEKQQTLAIEQKAEIKIRQILANKEKALERLKLETEGKAKVFETQLEELRLQKELTRSCVTFCDNILDKGKDEEVLMLEKIVTDRLLHLQHGQDTEVGGLRDPVKDDKSLLVEKPQPETDTKHVEVGAAEGKDNKSLKAEETHSLTTSVDATGVTVAETQPGDQNAGSSDIALELCHIIQIHYDTDTKVPDIKGLAFSAKIGLIVSDKANKKLKIVNLQGELKSTITMDDFTPQAVAVSGNVIGVINDNFLFLVNVAGKLLNKILLQGRKPSSGLNFTYALAASKSKGFLVGNIMGDPKLRWYNIDGTLKMRMSAYINFPLANLSLDPNGNIVTCEWGTGIVRVLSWSSGATHTTCTRRLEWKPNAAQAMADGTVFVADYDEGAICVFDKLGSCKLLYNCKVDDLRKPTCLVLDNNGRLYVIEKMGNMCVYEVKKH